MSKRELTFIEIVIIVVTISIIALISTPAIKAYITRAKIDNAARSLQAIADQMVLYADKYGHFPTCEQLQMAAKGRGTIADDEIAAKHIPHYLPTSSGGFGMHMSDTSHNKWEGGGKPCGASARVQVGLELEEIGLNNSPFTEYEQGFVLECNMWKHKNKVYKVCFGGDVALGENADAAGDYLPTSWRPYNQWLAVLYNGQPESYGVNTLVCP